MYTIISLDQLRAHLGFAPDDTADDMRLVALLEAASITIERHTQRHFVPYVAALRHKVHRFQRRHLLLRDDLWLLQEVINGDGKVIPLSDLTVLEGGVLVSKHTPFVYQTYPDDTVTVTAIWGYHPQQDHAWDNNAAVVSAAITASTPTIAVNDSTPFSIGQLLRLGDEYLRVLLVDSAMNTLTVIRGAQGTTATAHSSSTAIAIYRPPADAAEATMQWAAWLYRHADRPAETTLPPVLRTHLDGLRRISM